MRYEDRNISLNYISFRITGSLVFLLVFHDNDCGQGLV